MAVLSGTFFPKLDLEKIIRHGTPIIPVCHKQAVAVDVLLKTHTDNRPS